LGYGFRSLVGDELRSSGTATVDTVLVRSKDSLESGSSVEVSYYKDATIHEVEEKIDDTRPRVYSRLAGGIVVLQ
jgi:hypothetical protein